MSATPLRPADAGLTHPRRIAGVAWALLVAIIVASGIALTMMLSQSGDAASEKAGQKIERPAHAPGANGEMRPT